ncbi:MAG: hypothetical protein PHC34_09275 [Candidatus Gastranaerophilales bacterium]|nr:hypothetical protein [Candidatus Gastranaerophilales bacterium]
MTQISFTSKIKFIPLYDFDNLAYSEKFSFVKMNKPPIKGENVGTKALGPCIGGGIYNDKGAMVFHYSDKYNFSKPCFLEGINKLKSADKLRGIIVGGYEEMSQATFNFFKNLFNELKIKPTIIYGQHDGSNLVATDIIYSAKEDTWFLNSSNILFRQNKINSPLDLKNYFSLINVTKGDQLFVGDKKVTLIKK